MQKLFLSATFMAFMACVSGAAVAAPSVIDATRILRAI